MFRVMRGLTQRTSGTNLWTDNIANKELVSDPTEEPPDFDLPRKQWSALNEILALHARTSHHLHKWISKDSSACDCGHPDQTIHHIVTECHLQKFDEIFKAVDITTDSAVTWLSNLDFDL